MSSRDQKKNLRVPAKRILIAEKYYNVYWLTDWLRTLRKFCVAAILIPSWRESFLKGLIKISILLSSASDTNIGIAISSFWTLGNIVVFYNLNFSSIPLLSFLHFLGITTKSCKNYMKTIFFLGKQNLKISTKLRKKIYNILVNIVLNF